MCQILDVLFRFSRVRRTGKQMLEKKERKSKASFETGAYSETRQFKLAKPVCGFCMREIVQVIISDDPRCQDSSSRSSSSSSSTLQRSDEDRAVLYD